MAKNTSTSVIWLVPALFEGSGGQRTLLTHAHAMATAGYDVTLCLETISPRFRGCPGNQIERLYGLTFPKVVVGWDALPSSDCVVATSWVSAHFAAQSKAPLKVYFVQDWEASFLAMGSNSVFAEQTYELGFQHITIGRWLSRKLRGEVGADSAHFEFGADLNLYRPDPAANPAKPTVCFIHQPDKPRRGAELGLKALSWVQEKRPDVSLVLYGSDLNGPSSLNHKNLRLVKPKDCAKIYQSSTVGLSLSLTNPSRVPFEMMACGLPVVELHRDSTVWDFPEDAMLLSKGSPEALGNALLRILDDAPLREKMSAAGIQFMKSRDESVETQQFMTHFNGLIAGGRLPDFTTSPLYERGPLSYSGPVRPPVQPLHYSRKTVAKRWLKAHALKILYELRKK